MMDITGLEPYRVYQRNEEGYADIPFELRFSTKVSGILQISVVSLQGEVTWKTLNSLKEPDRYAGKLKELPVGSYSISFRVVKDTASGSNTNEEVIAPVVVEPLFVGDLWILAGQSNMKGFGKLSWTEPPQLGISCFYLDDHWDLAVEPLCWLNESADPVHWTVSPAERSEAAAKERRERTQGAGLGISFAKEIFRHTGVPIGLVPCAKGATSMKDWDPERKEEGSNSLYGAMIRRIEKLGGTIRGCLWYQGESDANEEAAPQYRKRMRRWIERLRMDVSDPALPLIYAQLSVHYAGAEPRWWNTIQHEQYLLEQEMDQVAMIPTIDAGLSDIIHLDAYSLSLVGRRMAWQALRLAYEIQAYDSGPRPVQWNKFIWNEDRTVLEIQLIGVNGKLQKVDRLYGFHIEVDGMSLPYEASLCIEKSSILFRFEQSVTYPAQLSHGKGLNPLVNVFDQQQIPLIVFGPIDV